MNNEVAIMKDFQEFWNAINWNRLNKEAGHIVKYSELQLPIDDSDKLIFASCAAMLEQYHEWINAKNP